ncbi:MAG: glycerophosphodiester phosphodiesterase family protein, partial [Sodaliphilus sp.]|nr:glycerophosphodiester phosphodiesterase family protein [Sodaliphilus sp.]
YLQEFTKHPNIQVVLEVKPHADLIQESMCVMKALALVKHYELENRVTYITFSPNAMCELIKYAPKGTEVYYLNGEMPPKKLKEIGAAGMDYHYKVFKAHPEWIKECHDLGLKTNAWTVNKKEDLQWCIDNGIDFITTNEPVLLQKMLK